MLDERVPVMLTLSKGRIKNVDIFEIRNDGREPHNPLARHSRRPPYVHRCIDTHTYTHTHTQMQIEQEWPPE